MSGNFDTIKSQASSEKFNLIRIEHARAIEGDLALDSGTTYTFTYEFDNIFKMTVDGVEYTKVTSSPSSGEFTFDESTKAGSINLGVALASQIVVAFDYLFFSKDKARIAPEDPENSATTQRRWQPRIDQNPTFEFNLKDVTEGFLTFGSSSIVLSNEDSVFEKYLGVNDSFANRQVTIWLALDNVENVKLVYRGLVSQVVIGRKFTLSIFDEFSVLNSTYFSNGSFQNSSYNTTSFPSLHPVRENLPIRKLYAEVSRYKVIDEGTAAGLHRISPEELLEASCITFSTTISTSTNREWGTILNVGDGGLQTDTVQAVNHADPNFSLITYTNGKNYRIGDTLEIGGSKRVRVLFVDTGSDQMRTTKDATIATTEAITRPGISSIIVTQNNINYYCLFGRDYTVQYAGNTNDIIKVTFVTNFEASVGMSSPLNPDTDRVSFRAWGDTTSSYNHADVMKEILEDAGLTVNNASIVNSALTDVNTNFYVPAVDFGSFTTYASAIVDILRSMLGYISLNNDLEFEYHLFNSPGSSNTTTDREIILESFATNLDYNDIIDTIVPENPHDIIELNYTNAPLSSSRATYLHGVSKQKTYNHVLADTSRMQTVLNFLKERKALYGFTTKTNPDVIVGDDFQITRDDLVGNVASRNVTIVTINKESTQTSMSGYDLLGL